MRTGPQRQGRIRREEISPSRDNGPQTRGAFRIGPFRIAIDTGGTFTDCVYVSGGQLHFLKLLSTPSNPAEAIRNAVHQILASAARDGAITSVELRHGTTVGTNALLERKGARVALVTTAGFEDVIQIGRQNRPKLYDLLYQPPACLVPPELRFGVNERVATDGSVLRPLNRQEVERVAELVRQSGAEAIAISLLFCFRVPEHEQMLVEALQAIAPVSASHQILPEFREYERTSTTVINAYLQPLMRRYLGQIETVLDDAVNGPELRVRVMQSHGGMVSAASAAEQPVRTVLSGPACGVVGAHTIARLAGIRRIIGFDMGGTSTDVSLIDGTLCTQQETVIADLPISVPVLDIHTVGSGGGSLARFDAAGVLRVGPESAGADPGPIAYDRGGEQPTVTDAHVLLGRISPQRFLGSGLALDAEGVRSKVERWLKSHGRQESPLELAHGIVTVANAVMERAIRVISIERGHDPREFVLLAFGGAGGLHACELAAALHIPKVLLPIAPGALSALGVLMSSVVREFSRTVLWAAGDADVVPRLMRVFDDLSAGFRDALRAEGVDGAELRFIETLDVRYAGQGFSLPVPWQREQPLSFPAAFHQAHRERYGYCSEHAPLEVVNVRLRAEALSEPVQMARGKLSNRSARPDASIALASPSGVTQAAVYERERLSPGESFGGPAIITEYTATAFVPPRWSAVVDSYGNIRITQARDPRGRDL